MFWNNKMSEPKRNFRWILKIDGIAYYLIKEVNRPSYEISTSEHKFINHTFYFPGRVTYNEISFKLVDAVAPDATETLRQIIFAAGYRMPQTADVATQSMTKQAAVSALGDIQIVMLAGGGVKGSGADTPQTRTVGNNPMAHTEGDAVEMWTLHNAFITGVEFSQLSYDNDDLADATVKLRYDYAILNDPSTSPATGGRKVARPSQGVNFTPAATGQNPPRQD